MLDELTDTSLSAAMLTSILFEHRNGGNPWVTYSQAATCLNALGRPISEATVRSLIVKTSILNGKAVAPLGRFVEAADDYIARQTNRPNRKAAAVASARAAKRKAA